MRFRLQVLSVVSIASIIGFASSAAARIPSNFEGSLQYHSYPTAAPATNLFCYAKTNTRTTFDLARLCGFVTTPSPTSSNGGRTPSSTPSPASSFGSGTPSGASYRGGGTSSGVCNVPTDIARDGSQCGGRAASERPGGKR